MSGNLHTDPDISKVLLQRLDAPEGQANTEIVHAKFVVGADGKPNV